MSTAKARTIRLMLKASGIYQMFLLSTVGLLCITYGFSTYIPSF